MKYKSFLIIILILVFATSSLSFALTYDEEKKYGKEIYREIVQMAPVNNDPYISLLADSIKKKLEEKAQMPFPVTLTIIDSESVDAFATM
jgi:predicted Zn-dependent protease